MKHGGESYLKYVLCSKHPEEIEFVDANTDKEHPLVGVVLCLTSVLPEQRVSQLSPSFFLYLVL